MAIYHVGSWGKFLLSSFNYQTPCYPYQYRTHNSFLFRIYGIIVFFSFTVGFPALMVAISLIIASENGGIQSFVGEK